MYPKPELVATQPNQVWIRDITKLAGPAQGSRFYLYTIIDISSRYVLGWLVVTRENADCIRALATRGEWGHRPRRSRSRSTSV